jgi:tetratricopeptide (TPR) repeat protein
VLLCPIVVSTAEAQAPTLPQRRSALLLAVALVVLVCLAWANTFRAPFELDDDSSIRENATIRHVASFDWLNPPSTRGETVSGRPLLNLSFALNHALGGLDVRGYHAVNLAIHALAALALFGIVRRGLLAPRLRSASGLPVDEAGATSLAFIVAAIWSLHPIQTESVTYIVQRAQSLMGLFCLLAVYCFLRGSVWAAPHPAGSDDRNETRGGGTLPRRSMSARRWYALSVAACAAGMATKEDMVVVPCVVLLADRALVAGSFREAWRQRRGYYGALASTWIVLGVLLATNLNRGGSAGFGTGISPVTYALTQAGAWCRYLWLAVWPANLVFDHGTATVAGPGAVVPQLIVVAVLIAATVWLLVRNRVAGLLGACFCLALAPSSSVVPVATQTVAEHRMYLALAPLVLALAVAAVRTVTFRRRAPLAVLAITVAGGLTFLRNGAYASAAKLWRDTATRVPANDRAHNNLGLALLAEGRADAAVREFQRAVELRPNHAFAHANLGLALMMQRQWDRAAAELNTALATDPHIVNARVNLGYVLTQLGRTADAMAQYQQAVAADPAAIDARTNLAGLLIDARRAGEARPLLRDVLAAAPNLPPAHFQLARALEQLGAATDAEAEYRESLRLKPDFADAHLALGNLLVQRGAISEAELEYREALRLEADRAATHYALGNLLARQQQFDRAMAEYNEALRLEPTHLEARGNRANCELVTGRLRDAIADYEAVLQARPGDATISQNLALARQLVVRQPH